jgi:hypothetical protein
LKTVNNNDIKTIQIYSYTMRIYNAIFLLFATTYTTSAFTTTPNYSNRIANISLCNKRAITGLYLGERDICKRIGIIPDKTMEELRKESYIGIAVADVADDNYTDLNNSVSTKTKAKIDDVLNKVMKSCKNNKAEIAIRNLQKYCTDSNIIKNKNTKALTFYLQNSKYGLLLGKFVQYDIIGYTKNKEYYDVEMKVSAEYKTMLKNNIRFNDMYYPKNRDYNNVCYVIYRWRFKKYEDSNLYIDGCHLLRPMIQI